MNTSKVAVISTTTEYPDDMEQLALLFSVQKMTADAADELVLRESQKTVEVYQGFMADSKTETQLLMSEIAALRERLATKESHEKELIALHAAEKKVIQERSDEEIAALTKSLKKQKKRTKALDKLLKQHIEDGKQSLEFQTPETKRHIILIYTTLDEKRKLAGHKK